MGRKRLFDTILSCGSLVLISCAMRSTVSVQVQKPAAVHLAGVQKVAVADLQGPDRSGSQIAATVQSMLLETKYFDLLEREKLGQILDEQKLGMSGVVDDATAVEVGKLLGVNAMVFGEVTVFRVEPDEFGSEKVERKVGTGKYEEVDEKNIFTGKTRKVKREIMRTVLVDQPYRIRRGTVSINFRVVDVQTGRLLAVHSDSRSYNSGKVNEGGYRTLPPEGQILDDLSRTICQKFVRTIAPYYSTERRPIESGKGPIQVGKKYAEAGLWPEALDAWQKAVVELPKEPAAHYNLGLAHEILGDLDKAEASFKTAVSISQKRLYMDAIQRIRQTRVENEKLREQLFERQQSPPVPPGP